jgi:hypothetical protein
MGSKAKTIKISEENYKWLVKVAAEIQSKKLEPISLDEALSLIKSNSKRK